MLAIQPGIFFLPTRYYWDSKSCNRAIKKCRIALNIWDTNFVSASFVKVFFQWWQLWPIRKQGCTDLYTIPATLKWVCFYVTSLTQYIVATYIHCDKMSFFLKFCYIYLPCQNFYIQNTVCTAYGLAILPQPTYFTPVEPLEF